MLFHFPLPIILS